MRTHATHRTAHVPTAARGTVFTTHPATDLARRINLIASFAVLGVAAVARAQSCGAPVGYWSFDAGDGADSSGAGNDGTAFNCATVTGVSGTAFAFDGTTSWVVCPHRESQTLPQRLTISLWARFSSESFSGNMFSKGDECSSEGNYNLYITNGRPQFQYWDGVGSNKILTATDPIALDQWHHVAARADFANRTVTIFVEGVAVPASWAGNPPAASNALSVLNPLTIGAERVNQSGGACEPYPVGAPVELFAGALDEVRLYNRLLSDDQIRVLARNPDGRPLVEPDVVTICSSGTATFSATAADSGPFTHRWQVQSPPGGASWVNIVDGLNSVPGVSPFDAAGTLTATLTVTVTRNNGAGGSSPDTAFRCLVSNPCATATSNPATLTLCAADFNCDGFLDFFDYDDFVTCFETGSCGLGSPDFNGDGFVDFFDYDEFVLAFETGC
jgi:hypothetical protein